MDLDRHEPAQLADRLADAAAGRGFDAFEVRSEATRSLTYVMEPNGEWSVNANGRVGVSIRVWRAGAAAHASVLDPAPEDLASVLDRASRLADASARHRSRTFPPSISSPARATFRPSIGGDPFEAGDERMVGILRATREAAQAVAPDAPTVRTGLSASERIVSVVNSAGGGADVRHYHSGAFAQVMCKDQGRVAEHVGIESGVYGVDDMRAAGIPERVGARAAELALEGLKAEAAKAGRHRVLVDNEMSGLLAHESFGHLTEYDLLATGWSVLKDRLGARLADERLSVVDSPVPPGGGREGVHVAVDDEGTRGRDVRVLDRGVFAAAMHQRDSARSVDERPTGNGRALGVRFQPIVRMRNTYFEPGDMSFDEALEALGDGYYLCGGRGGSPHSDGSFMFTSSHGYRVEGGKIVAPIKGTSIVGNILNYLPNVEGITKDFRLFSNTFAGCGKWDQNFIHVSLGGPHILASDVLLGGQGAATGGVA